MSVFHNHFALKGPNYNQTFPLQIYFSEVQYDLFLFSPFEKKKIKAILSISVSFMTYSPFYIFEAALRGEKSNLGSQ